MIADSLMACFIRQITIKECPKTLPSNFSTAGVMNMLVGMTYFLAGPSFAETGMREMKSHRLFLLDPKMPFSLIFSLSLVL